MDSGKNKPNTNANPEEDTLGQIFMSWIKDTHESPTRENFIRLQEVMDKGCTDKQFIMRSQRLGVNSAITIARILDRTPIEKIDVYENVIRDHGVQALSQLVRGSRTLTHLNVGGNDIGPLGCAFIAPLLAQNKRLKYLVLGSEEGDLHTNKIDSDAGKALAEALIANKTLKWLDLNRNPLGRDSQDVFASFVKVLQTNKTLETLKLGCTGMSSTSAVAIVKALNNNQVMQFLDCHENDLQPQVGEAFAELLDYKYQEGIPNTLTTLLLHHNPKLRARGLVPLFKALHNDNSIQTLDFSNTAMGDEGAAALADALRNNSTITHLELNDNDISQEGCIQLCLVLQQNKSVRYLALAHNKLKDDGACALAATLEVNESISHLELSSTRLSDRGAVALGVALAMNMSLQALKVNNNHISDNAGRAFSELIEKNGKLLTIDIRGNQVSHSTLLRIKKVVKRNKALRDGETPNQLQQEVIRLHYQQYKLQEANAELKEHQRARLELQEQADRAEREAIVEKENTAKRSKEIIEKILLQENFCDDMKAKKKTKEEEAGKSKGQYEQEIKALHEKLRVDSILREERQKEWEDIEKSYKRLEKEREEKLKDLKQKIQNARIDRDNWNQKKKEYRIQAQQSQEKIAELEAQMQARQAEIMEQHEAEQERKARRRAKKKGPTAAENAALIDSLLSGNYAAEAGV
eukprot:TRINITY_DN66822_c5_g6_i1.p1 TRINITY_DN66822_c5_g6~~TRINITY_DN66822_c5_g6_i1.p1  ORF type:complete len:694 (-),score=88.32 TRINITY_DN66822_c5_g6_i1:181-2262(-)